MHKEDASKTIFFFFIVRFACAKYAATTFSSYLMEKRGNSREKSRYLLDRAIDSLFPD